MSNAFTLNSAEQSPTTRRAEQRARGVQRRFNIAPLRMNYSEGAEAMGAVTPEKELSFYEAHSPQQSPLPCPIDSCMESDLSPETSPARYAVSASHAVVRRLDDDPNSVDSGFSSSDAPAAPGTSGSAGSLIFKFVQPNGLAPRKTPAKSPTASLKIFHSLSSSSMESADDDIELFEMDDDDTGSASRQLLPNDLSSLLSGNIKAVRNTPEHKAAAASTPTGLISRPTARRSLSLNESVRRTKSNLFDTTPERRTPLQQRTNVIVSTTPVTSKTTFKRPEPPSGVSPNQAKRLKFENTAPSAQENVEPQLLNSPQLVKPARPLFKKSVSMNDSCIMTALARCKLKIDLT